MRSGTNWSSICPQIQSWSFRLVIAGRSSRFSPCKFCDFCVDIRDTLLQPGLSPQPDSFNCFNSWQSVAKFIRKYEYTVLRGCSVCWGCHRWATGNMYLFVFLVEELSSAPICYKHHRNDAWLQSSRMWRNISHKEMLCTRQARSSCDQSVPATKTES